LELLFKDNVGGLFYCNEHDRKKLHLAAVFASNFSNHLFALCYRLCLENQVDFKALIPLIHSTSMRQNGDNPAKFQTGPAVRLDYGILKAQTQALENSKLLQKLYMLFSDSIIELKQNA
jgi:predicted short-subunit dehydrogenase-like oxidoreductase (DUF2520 family)